MKKTLLILLLTMLAVLPMGCRKFNGDYTVPAYLHLDRMYVDNDMSLSSDAGFFTSFIDAVQMEVWFDGVDTTTNLGTFQLPCTIPILCDRTIKKIQIYPFVRQNGIAGTRIYYPYYQPVTLTNLPLTADSVTNLGTQDAQGLWALPVNYYGSPMLTVLADEYFEPATFGTIFDTNVTATHYDGNACTGAGYGVVHLSKDTPSLDFEINKTFNVTDHSKRLYLEMEYRNDMRLSVQMRSAYMVGANEQTEHIMTLYENSQWQKIYINLGGAWADFSHNPNFHIVFTAINPDGKEGDIRLDNVKVIAI